MGRIRSGIHPKQSNEKLKIVVAKEESSVYNTWLKVYDVPSLGRSSRIKGWKIEREHSSLCLENSYFKLLEWSVIKVLTFSTSDQKT